LDRFKREGIALAKLRHPGIVPIYDICEHGDLIYYIMPFIDGENLKDRLERLGRLPPFEAHRILSELADAVTAAHRSGIIHRDIKPENIILEGNLRKVLLMDFGIAKAAESETQRLTGSGVLVGTPTYMSPEQAGGDSEIDHRADIYALGVLGYHMAVGELPFTGTPQQVLVKHITDVPASVRKLNPSVPKSLSQIIARCLAKQPAERYATAMDLWRDLQTVTFFANEPTQKPRTRVPKLELISMLVLVVGLLAGLSLGKMIFQEPTTPRGQQAAMRPSPAQFLTGWLANVREVGQQAASDSAVSAPIDAFDPLAVMAHVLPGTDPASPSVQLTPQQLLSHHDYVQLLANIDGSRMLVRDYGQVAVAVVPYSDSATVCGTATFTLRLSDNEWRLLLLQLHDSGADCN
jgi:serine/threonine protein kinase